MKKITILFTACVLLVLISCNSQDTPAATKENKEETIQVEETVEEPQEEKPHLTIEKTATIEEQIPIPDFETPNLDMYAKDYQQLMDNMIGEMQKTEDIDERKKIAEKYIPKLGPLSQEYAKTLNATMESKSDQTKLKEFNQDLSDKINKWLE